VIQPVLCILLAIQPSRLYVDIFVGWVKINVLDRCNVASLLVRDADGFEVWWCDEAVSLSVSMNVDCSRNTDYTFCPGFGNSPSIDSTANEPIAPLSSLPGIPL